MKEIDAGAGQHAAVSEEVYPAAALRDGLITFVLLHRWRCNSMMRAVETPRLETAMWLAGWAVRVVLLITAPIYFLCRFIAAWMSRLDEWSWRAIHEREPKKPPQSETAQPEETAKRMLR